MKAATLYGLILAAGLAACGGDSSPTAPECTPQRAAAGLCVLPADPLCPLSLTPEPVSGFPGLYTVIVSPAGPYDLTINGVSRVVERGQLVFAETNDLVQGCRACGCSRSVVIR